MKISNYSILIATKNKGKIQEISKLLSRSQNIHFNIKSLNNYNIAEPDEPYETFKENAIHKAKYYASLSNEPSLSDDSGLCIEALGGVPGVRSKEFIAANGGLISAVAKLEQMLLATGSNNYQATLHTCIALYIPKSNTIISNEAQLSGTIVLPGRGAEGFGFAPIFMPDGFDKTLAELSIEVKNKISHRSKAMVGFIDQLLKFLR